MSQQLISRNPCLRRLREEGYTVEIRSAYLLVHDVPFLTPDRDVRRGTLVSTLTMAGDQVLAPDTHVVMFTGLNPCDSQGRVLHRIINATGRHEVAPGIVIEHHFFEQARRGLRGLLREDHDIRQHACRPCGSD